MSHAGGYIPARESDLVQWMQNYVTLLSNSPETFGVTIEQANEMSTLFDEFRIAYTVANNAMTRSPGNIQIKDEKKGPMIEYARLLARQIQGTPTVTNAQKMELGLNVKSEPEPVPPPADPPEMDIFAVIGRTVKFRLHNEKTLGHRGRPHNVAGASVFSYIGESAPDDIEQWKFEGSSSRTLVDVTFPVTVAPGSKVWLTAFWVNGKMQSGPACEPQGINLAGGMSKAA